MRQIASKVPETQYFIPFHSITIMKKMVDSGLREDGLTCVVMATSYCETFLNDLHRSFQFVVDSWSTGKSQENITGNLCFNMGLPCTEKELLLSKFLGSEEFKNQKMIRKYTSLVEHLSGQKVAGTKVYQELKNVIDIRNDIVHSKGLTLQIHYDKNGLEVPPKLDDYPCHVKQLMKNKILERPQQIDSWLHLLDSKIFCDWVMDTVTSIQTNILELIEPLGISAKVFVGNYYV